MTPFKLNHILLATDFSNCAANALNSAVPLAKRHGSRLTIAHVIDNSCIQFANENRIVCAPTGQLVKVACDNLRVLTANLSDEHQLDVRFEVLVGTPVYKICQYSKSESIDLIVVGKRGEFNAPEVRVGDIASGIVRKAATPVLCVPSRKPFSTIKKILFPVQEFNTLMNDYRMIRQLGTVSDATYVVAAVAENKMHNVHRARLRRLVQFMLNKIERDGLSSKRRMKVGENISRELIAITHEEKPDLIFLPKPTNRERSHSTNGYMVDVLAGSECAVLSINEHVIFQ